MLFHLVYRSHAAPGISELDIQDILCQSRDYNRSHNLTGLLTYRQHAFVQLLEGPENEVRTVYSKIRRDPRHQGVVTMIEAGTLVNGLCG